MYIKITEENLDYINKARKKYFDRNNIGLNENYIDCNDLSYVGGNSFHYLTTYISFEKFKSMFPLEEQNKPIELW
jgi:predicted SprT family Zn-dependent metalloprotease